MTGLVRQSVVKGWQLLRASWLMIGMSLIFLLLAESCARTVRAAKGDPTEQRVTPAAYAHAAWYPGYVEEFDATRPQRWKSYVYFGRLPSFHGRYINIDSAGHRATPQPQGTNPAQARVFFFGGSTMWGTPQRDSFTIAAEASRRLQQVVAPGQRVEITNFGETGYVSTQGVIELMLQLRAGNRPDVVVFYDGINDVFATVQAGEAGIPQNESKRVSEFAMGRALDRTGFAHGLRKDLHAWGVLTVSAFRQLALVEWLQSLLPPPHEPPLISADSATRSTVRVYTENMRMVDALAKTYGFTAIYVWQPSIHGTPKPLTPFETRIMRGIDRNAVQRRMKEVHLAAPKLLDSAMATVAPGRFIDEASLFRNDSSEIFVDRIGHTVEASVPTIVDGFWPVLRTAVQGALAKTPAGGRPVQAPAQQRRSS